MLALRSVAFLPLFTPCNSFGGASQLATKGGGSPWVLMLLDAARGGRSEMLPVSGDGLHSSRLGNILSLLCKLWAQDSVCWGRAWRLVTTDLQHLWCEGWLPTRRQAGVHAAGRWEWGAGR